MQGSGYQWAKKWTGGSDKMRVSPGALKLGRGDPLEFGRHRLALSS